MVMTSLPPPLTSKTRSNPSVRTSRNSMSGERIREKRFKTLRVGCSLSAFSLSYKERIQFSSPSEFLGGPGMLSSTSLASWDLLTMTSLSLTAVCIRLTLEWSLEEKSDAFRCCRTAERGGGIAHHTHGLMLSISLKPSGVEQPECVALYCNVFSLVQVIWTRRWCSVLPPPLGLSLSPSVSSSSSEPMLVRRSMELRSFTSWA